MAGRLRERLSLATVARDGRYRIPSDRVHRNAKLVMDGPAGALFEHVEPGEGEAWRPGVGGILLRKREFRVADDMGAHGIIEAAKRLREEIERILRALSEEGGADPTSEERVSSHGREVGEMYLSGLVGSAPMRETTDPHDLSEDEVVLNCVVRKSGSSQRGWSIQPSSPSPTRTGITRIGSRPWCAADTSLRSPRKGMEPQNLSPMPTG
jgi:hypothetical protein